MMFKDVQRGPVGPILDPVSLLELVSLPRFVLSTSVLKWSF